MKVLKFLTWASIAMLAGMSVVSCGDDDDNDIKDPTENTGGNGGNGGNDNPGTEIPESSPSVFGGLTLMSVTTTYNTEYESPSNVTTFSYDSNRLISSINQYGNTWSVDFKNGTILITEGDDFAQTANITTTKNGLITSVSTQSLEYYGDIVLPATIKWEFQYNSNDHLTKVIYNYAAKNSAGNVVSSENVVHTLQWNGNRLTAVNAEGKDIYDGDTNLWSRTSTFSYDETYANPYMQYTSSLIDAIDLDSSIDVCLLVGCFGKGPDELPSRINLVDSEISDEYTQTSSEQTDIAYTFRTDGLIDIENGTTTDEYDSYSYSAAYAYSDSPAAAKAMAAQANPGTKHKSLRRARHNTTLRLNK